MRKHIRLLLWSILINFAVALPLVAQSQEPATLIADQIIIQDGGKYLVASGNIEIYVNGQILRATRITYNQKEDTIIVEGPLYISDGENFTLVADFATLSPNIQSGVLRGARMVMNQQMQVSAAEINLIDGRYIQFYKTVASSCEVCAAHPTPLWQIRAKRIIHDREAQQLYFENASFEVMGIPIAYLPRLRLPDPTVTRTSGFLVPEVRSSSVLGWGMEVPYFLTMGDHADVTIAPIVTGSGINTATARYRHRFKRGQLDIEGAISSDDLTSQQLRAYMFAVGLWDFGHGYKGKLRFEVASDRDYLRDYGFSEKDRLDSSLRVEKVTNSSYFTSGIDTFTSLRPSASNDTIPFLLGEFFYRKRWKPNGVGGQAGLTFQSNGLLRRSDVDGADGRDMVRVSGVADWRREWRLNSGILLNAVGEVHADYYQVYNDSAYSEPVFRATPIAGVELRWPWARSTKNARHVIEPTVQIVWSPSSPIDVPNEDSLQVEFEETNLFSLNRFAGSDRYERGLRANIGVTYSRTSTEGLRFSATLGQVFRTEDLGQFTDASGLSGLRSDFVSAVELSLPDRLSFTNRTLFDNKFHVSKNETRLSYNNDRFDVATSYVWLEKDILVNATENRSEWTLDAGYDLSRNWHARADWRYDFIAAAPQRAGLNLTYRNECVKVDLSLSRRFDSSTNVDPTTTFGFRVALEGFGNSGDGESFKHRCSAL